MRGLIAGILAVAMGPVGAADTDEAANHCHDKEANQRWEELAAENHGSEGRGRGRPAGSLIHDGRGSHHPCGRRAGSSPSGTPKS